jgi:hypothetical protein
MSHQAVVAAASPEGGTKPVSLAAKLAAAEVELACLKLALAQVQEDREELRQNRDKLRQERDDWRREARTLCAEKFIAAKLQEDDERRNRNGDAPWGKRLALKRSRAGRRSLGWGWARWASPRRG